MAKSTVISTKIDASLKEDVTVIFKRLGLSATEAITLFYKMVKRKNVLNHARKEIQYQWPSLHIK